MSTHMTDRIEAVVFRAADTHHRFGDDVYLLCELGGDSNCFDHSGRRARDWSATVAGCEWEVIQNVCRVASDCAGGMLRLTGRGNTKPEAYIRAYRKAMANAAEGFAGAGQRGLIITPRIRYAVGETTNGQKYQYDQLCKLRTPKDETASGHAYKVFSIDTSKPEDIQLWAEHLRNPAWHSAEVYGSTR